MKKNGTKTMDVDIFIPCCVDQLYPHIGLNTIKVLEHLNVHALYNPEQICCGQTAFRNGFMEEAKEIGEKFLHDFSQKRPIVSPSSSCINYIRTHFKDLFFNTGLHLECKELQEYLYEFTDFLVNMLRVTNIGAEFPHKVCLHDHCRSLRESGLQEEPRILLKNVKGLEFIEMKDSDECCGFGGSFSLNFDKIATEITRQKLQNAMDSGAEYICSTEPSCLANMEAFVKKQKLPIKCIHISDILASGI